MLLETKTYWVDGWNCPSNEDIDMACDIAKSHNCMVELCWIGPDNKYYGGHHSRLVNSETDAEEMKKSIRGIVYGL